VSSPASPEDIAALERCALNAWPALEKRDCMGWVLRSAGGYTKRANSANALVPHEDFGQLRHEAEAHYAALGLPATFRLSHLASPGTDEMLEAAGYALVEPSLVMTAPLDRAAPDPSVEILSRADEAWLHGFAQATDEVPETIERHRALLDAISPPHRLASISHGGRAIAFGLAVIEEHWVGLFDIAVNSAHRGAGYARTLSAALLAWGRSAGAGRAYLQVTRANGAALSVYSSLGFAEAYRYHYRVAPGAGSTGRSLLDDSHRQS
jgi:GNAT superfamily N-acetyltransferase